MITAMQMYWLVILDNIVATSIILMAAGIASSIVAFLGHTIDSWPRWPLVTSLVMALIAMTTLTFVPTTKQAAAIIIVPKLANSEKVQTVGNHLYELAVEWMEELRPPKKEGK